MVKLERVAKEINFIDFMTKITKCKMSDYTEVSLF